MTHETQVRNFLKDKKPGDALIYLAQSLDDFDWDPTPPPDERPSDPEDGVAWDAAQRLAADAKREPTPNVMAPPTSLIERSITEHSIDITFPPPTPEQSARRYQMIDRLKLDQENWYLQHIPPCGDQYLDGGPVWLYLAYRQYMETLPRAIIHEMVLDVFEWSPGDAEIISADLLRRQDDENEAASRYDVAVSNLVV